MPEPIRLGKLLLLLIAIVLVYWIVASYKRNVQNQQKPRQPQSGAAEDMVRCAHCGVHLPRSESVTSRGEFFCSDEHRRLHRQ